MRKHRLPQKVCLFVILLAVLGWGLNTRIHRSGETGSDTEQQSVIMDVARGIFDREPSEVQDLREQSIAETDEGGYQEYYFNLLGDDERRIYREMLDGIEKR